MKNGRHYRLPQTERETKEKALLLTRSQLEVEALA